MPNLITAKGTALGEANLSGQGWSQEKSVTQDPDSNCNAGAPKVDCGFNVPSRDQNKVVLLRLRWLLIWRL